MSERDGQRDAVGLGISEGLFERPIDRHAEAFAVAAPFARDVIAGGVEIGLELRSAPSGEYEIFVGPEDD